MRRLPGLILCAVLLAGCAAPQPLLLSGDATSIDIAYGSDPAATLRVAKLHCAAFERVPRLLQAQNNVAYYACVPPPPVARPATGS